MKTFVTNGILYNSIDFSKVQLLVHHTTEEEKGSFIVLTNGNCTSKNFSGTVIHKEGILNGIRIGDFDTNWSKKLFQKINHKISITFNAD